MMDWISLYRAPTPSPTSTWNPPALVAHPDIRYGTPHHGPAQHLLVTSDGHHWRPVQTCSFEDPPPPPTGTDVWLLKHIPLARTRYASCWNDFFVKWMKRQHREKCKRLGIYKADPDFRGAPTPKWRHQLIIGLNLPENCIKIKKIGRETSVQNLTM